MSVILRMRLQIMNMARTSAWREAGKSGPKPRGMTAGSPTKEPQADRHVGSPFPPAWNACRLRTGERRPETRTRSRHGGMRFVSRYPSSGGPLPESECASLGTDRQRAGHDRNGAASGASVVLAHETRVTRHVSREDRCELPFNWL